MKGRNTGSIGRRLIPFPSVCASAPRYLLLSSSDIRKWIADVQSFAESNVNIVLIGNKSHPQRTSGGREGGSICAATQLARVVLTLVVCCVVVLSEQCSGAIWWMRR